MGNPQEVHNMHRHKDLFEISSNPNNYEYAMSSSYGYRPSGYYGNPSLNYINVYESDEPWKVHQLPEAQTTNLETNFY